jgi:hypothetical protein
MAGGVDEVKDILFPVLRLMDKAHGLGLYRDAPLALQVHIIQYLILHLAGGEQAGLLDKPVRQRGLAVVYMSDYTKIADVLVC